MPGQWVAVALRATLRLRLNAWLCFSLGVQLGDLLPVWRWPSERSLATLSLSVPLCVTNLPFLVPDDNGGSLDCLKDRIAPCLCKGFDKTILRAWLPSMP